MKVTILQRIEDANEFPDLNDPLVSVQPFSVGHRQYKHHIARVDKLSPNLGEVDLPQSQAEKLVALGYAVA